jgi:hypothetical protein
VSRGLSGWGLVWQPRCGESMHVEARHGESRRVPARQGMASQGEFRRGKAVMSGVSGRVRARLAVARQSWQGERWLVTVWTDAVRFGKAAKACRDLARSGGFRFGKAVSLW